MKCLLLKRQYRIKHAIVAALSAALCTVAVGMLGCSSPQPDTSILFSFKQNLYRVHASGKLEKIFSAKNPNASLHISPDQSIVVFSKEDDLWLWDVKTNKTERITNVGKPSTSQYAGVRAYYRLWAKDGSKIIYNVWHDDLADPGCDCDSAPPLKARPGQYGTFVYDLKTKTSKPFALPEGQIIVWFDDGKYLIEKNDEIVLIDKLKKTERPFALGRSAGQIYLSADGKYMLSSISNGMKMSQIVKVDWENGQITHLTPEGRFAEYQTPKFSPSGKRVAYRRELRETRRKNGKIVFQKNENLLIENTRTIYQDADHFTHDWIGESMMVIVNGKKNEAIVLDVNAKQVVARHKLD